MMPPVQRLPMKWFCNPAAVVTGKHLLVIGCLSTLTYPSYKTASTGRFSYTNRFLQLPSVISKT
ncbi:MAG: hypothetical protein WB664_02735 [Nitrososphaeraceae archaeon]